MKTDFFDVPSNLVTGTFSPLRKSKSLPLYIDAKSNHPPTFIKSRYNNHTKSFLRWHNKQDTELSKLQDKDINFTVKYNIAAYASTHGCGLRKCDLYWRKKYVTARVNQKNLLSKSTELISKCRHKNKYI